MNDIYLSLDYSTQGIWLSDKNYGTYREARKKNNKLSRDINSQQNQTYVTQMLELSREF